MVFTVTSTLGVVQPTSTITCLGHASVESDDDGFPLGHLSAPPCPNKIKRTDTDSSDGIAASARRLMSSWKSCGAALGTKESRVV